MSSKILIRKLIVNNFRGIETLEWLPESGLNMIIGGGDCGKTTVLEAIAVLFHPGNNLNINETDFWNRNTKEEFTIEAVVSKNSDFEWGNNKIYWPWEWDGSNAVLPTGAEDDIPDSQCPVFRVIAIGSREFDISWEVIQPDGSHDYFSTGARKNIGLVKLSGDDKNDRDLRLVYGSALDRLLSDKNLKSKIANSVAKIPLKDELADESKASLSELDASLEKLHLPHGLDIGMITSRGLSIGALIGLLANKNGVMLPVSTWGAGTRRMTALEISSTNESESKLTIIDELEQGLEPYRLRQLVNFLQDMSAQSFVTTHSPIALSCATGAQIYYMDADGNLGKLNKNKISSQRLRDAETFLSKVSVIAEGETEQGFISAILEKLFDGNPLDAGTRVCLGQGDAQTLDLLEALSISGLKFGGFVDNDSGKIERWGELKKKMGERLFQWDVGCIESNILPSITSKQIESLFKDRDGDWDGNRLRTIADRLGLEDKSFDNINTEVENQKVDLIDIIIQAATGNTEKAEDRSTKKSWKKHEKNWFKKADGSGGRELLRHLVESDKWSEFEPKFRPFFNSILKLAGKPEVDVIEL